MLATLPGELAYLVESDVTSSLAKLQVVAS
jgi:hypothetical protein